MKSSSVLISSLLILLLSSCGKETYDNKYLAGNPESASTGKNYTTLGNDIHPQPSAWDKYVVAGEIRIPGQYIIVLDPAFIQPGALTDTLSADSRETGSRKAEKRRIGHEVKIRSFLSEAGIQADQVIHFYTEALTGFSARLSEAEVKILLAKPEVLFVEEDQVIVVDLPRPEAEGTPMGRAQTIPCGISRHNGPGNGASSSKWIWIVDSGISTHADLNVVTNTTYAKSFSGGSYLDCQGHGTHVAGIAAAKNNSFGVVGMSAGAPVVPVKVMTGCTNSYIGSNLIAGLNHVAIYDEAGDVVNMSLGGPYTGSGSCASYSSFKTAVQNITAGGSWAVIAAGNDNQPVNNFQPACLNGTRILTIANMTCNNNWNWTSNYGTPPIDWIAVGSNVVSTYLNGQYNTLSGTSMSAPHVSGIVHTRQTTPAQCGWVYRNNIAYKVACR